MRHSLTMQGFGVRVRPVQLEDAAFIVWLRNLGHVRGRVGDSAADVASQEKWLEGYFERDGDYYFLIETLTGIRSGTFGVYNLAGSSAEFGRVAGRPGANVFAPAGILLFDRFYGEMGLTEVRANCVASNYKMLHALTKKIGMRQVGVKHAGQLIGGKEIDLLNFSQTPEEWLGVREAIVRRARVGEAGIRKWEEAYHRSRDAKESFDAEKFSSYEYKF